MIFNRIIKGYAKILRIFLVVIFYALLFVVFIQIIGRYIRFVQFSWASEVARFFLIWLIFTGSTLAVKEEEHFFLDIFRIDFKAHPYRSKFLRIIYYICMFLIIIFWCIVGYPYFLKGFARFTIVAHINYALINGVILLASISMFLFLINNFIEEFFIKRHRDKDKIKMHDNKKIRVKRG